MSLKHRIIPVLLTDGQGQCVKPVAFERPYRKLGTMEQYIHTMESRDVDELIIIDIEATKEGRKPDYEKLRSWCDNLFCPVTYGGGISSVDDIRLALENGADKVAICHGGSDWEFILKAVEKFGAQAIVGITEEMTDIIGYDQFHIRYYCNSLTEWLNLNIGELLIISYGREGIMEGYNIDMIRKYIKYLPIPSIVLGGCGDPSHMAEALDAGASAVAAGSMFLYTDETPKSCAKYLQKRGYPVRV